MDSRLSPSEFQNLLSHLSDSLISKEAGEAHLHQVGGSENFRQHPRVRSFFRHHYQQRRKQRYLCSFPKELGGCSKYSIRSHSVQRNGGLSLIAEGGKVYSCVDFTTSPTTSISDPSPKLLGHQKQASVFFGFCGDHDRDLFKGAEVDAEQPSPLVASTLHLRALLFERWCKENIQFQGYREWMSAEPMKNDDVTSWVLDSVRYQERQGKYGAMDVDDQLQKLLAGGLSSYQNRLKSYYMDFEGLPVVAACGCFCPEFLRDGRSLYNLLDDNFRGPKLSINIVPHTTESTRIWISWPLAEDQKMQSFFDELTVYPVNQQASAMFSMAADTIENIHFRPSFWENLSLQQKREFLGHMHNKAPGSSQYGARRMKFFGKRAATGFILAS